MSIDRVSALLCLALLAAGAPSRAADWSVTVLPRASIRYRGEGKVLPQGYVNRFDGETSPVYRFEFRQAPSRRGSWGLALWHTGVFGGGKYAAETVPDDTTGGAYQTDLLNVGFTNLFVTHRRSLAGWPVEAEVSFSVVREIFKRKEFVIQGADLRATGFDDVNEISAEGFGFGLAGLHGERFYARWRVAANYYVQLFDAKTDASAGHIFQAEGGFGWRLARDFSIEAGGLRQYWFILGQGNRRVEAPNGSGAVISWNRQETRTSGFYLRAERRFTPRGSEER